MRPYPESGLKEIEIRIIEELATDGRIPIKHLAAKAGISRRTARNILQRITNNNIIKVKAFPIWQLKGLPIKASVGINVKSNHNVYAIAEKLAEYPNFLLVALATGPYEIVTWAFFESLESLSVFLRHEVGKIPGIASSETQLHLETVKYLRMYPISEEASVTPDNFLFPKKKRTHEYFPDRLDMAIIEELQRDGRMSIEELSKRIGISRVSVSKRLNRLLSEDIITIVAITAPDWFPVTARIGIKLLPGKSDEIARILGALPPVHFIAMTLGYYDILIGVHFSSLHQMSHFIMGELKNIPNIVKIDSMVYLEFIKSPFESVTMTGFRE